MASTSTAADQALWYDKLMRFYEFYAPDKVPTAAITLKAYEGREELMFRSLEKKYGPMSAVPPPPKNRTPRTPAVAEPQPNAAAAAAASRSQSRIAMSAEASLAAIAVDVDPPSIPPLPRLHYDVYRVRLERFYQQYAPEKLTMVDTALEAYAGREEAMFKLLEKKYGPEPKAFVIVSPKKTPKYGDDDDDDDEEEDDEMDGMASGSGPSARRRAAAAEQVNPKSLHDPVPYDYFEALINAGFREGNIEEILALFGEGKEHYAAAVCLILTVVGHDALFDTNTELQFPVSKLRQVKKCEPDILDQIAFEHICTYKKVFVAAVEHSQHIRQMEALERSAILKELKVSMGQLSYRMVVLAEALKYIGPIEEERRLIVTDDERLRREGIFMWFRQRRQEIVDKIAARSGRFQHARGSGDEGDDGGDGDLGPEKDLDALEERFKVLCARQKHESHAIKEKWCSRANYNQRTENRSPSAARGHKKGSDQQGPSPSTEAEGPARPRWHQTGSAVGLRSSSLKSAATSGRTPSKSIPASSTSLQSAEVLREAESVMRNDAQQQTQQHQQHFNLFASARAKHVAKRGAFSAMGMHF